jgi:hypothetical protein
MLNALLTILILALIFGIVWWLFTALIPLPPPFAQIAQVIIALIFLLLILGVFFGGIHVPLLRL